MINSGQIHEKGHRSMQLMVPYHENTLLLLILTAQDDQEDEISSSSLKRYWISVTSVPVILV